MHVCAIEMDEIIAQITKRGVVDNMRENSMNLNDVLREIQHLKREMGKFSSLLGGEITHKVIEAIEEKEEEVLEHLMWNT
jgi:signal recognition particle GTPase